MEILYKDCRKELKKRLIHVPNISLSCDEWKSSTRSYYFCITGHFYNDQHQLQSCILSFHRFLGSHTFVRLRRFLLNELNKLGIQEKVTSITTDNGKDVRIAVSSRGFGTRFSCLCHNLNLTVQNGLWLHNKPKAVR